MLELLKINNTQCNGFVAEMCTRSVRRPMSQREGYQNTVWAWRNAVSEPKGVGCLILIRVFGSFLLIEKRTTVPSYAKRYQQK